MKQQPRTRLATICLMLTVLASHRAGAEDAATVVVGQPRSAAPHTVELPGSFEPYEDA